MRIWTRICVTTLSDRIKPFISRNPISLTGARRLKRPPYNENIAVLFHMRMQYSSQNSDRSGKKRAEYLSVFTACERIPYSLARVCFGDFPDIVMKANRPTSMELNKVFATARPE